MKILLIEDNTLLAKSLIRGLKEKKITVEHFTRGDDGERFCLNHHREIDLIILDLMLPGKSGESVCHSLREGGIQVPILILSAKDQKKDIVEGLDLGADDYLIKPFEFQELLARMYALYRRKDKKIEIGNIVISNSVEIDFRKREVYKNGKIVKISPKEFAVLEVLLKYRGKALSRLEIFNEVNDFADSPWSNSIDVYIKNLRKKLFYDEREVIKTIRGLGYRMD